MTKVIGAPTLYDALHALKEEIRRHEQKGEQTLVFCEDRLTLLAERAILEEVGGTFLTSVTTFARFLKGEERVLSKHGSVLEISALLAANREDLKCFGENAAQAVYETIAQLSASRVTPAMLKESAQESGGVLKFKLLDLALIFEKYEEFLQAHGLLDENGYLALLPSRIRSDVARGTHVVFFAFQSFTRQAIEGVCAAIESSLGVTGIFLAGGEGFYTNEAAKAFRMAAEEYGGAEKLQLKSTLCGEAEALKRSLFSHDGAGERLPAEKIFAFTAADEAEEMDTVAALIKREIAAGKRYSDIAVLIGDESYYLAALKAFEAYKIPFYADRKRKYSEHPFCAFALAVLNAVAGGPAPDEADDVAASVYFGDDGQYRNYLAKFGNFRGAVKKPIKDEAQLGGMDRKKLVACREKMLAILALFAREDRASAYADGIAKLWELVDGEGVTKKLCAAVSAEEQAFLGTARLEQCLKETEEIAGERKYTARAFATLLKNGLEAMEISMLPRYADTVFVGDITESKICRAPIVFCAGLTEGLPLITEDTAVITDGEIEKLKTLQVEIEPAIAVVNARAREALALNLLAFSERLYLSCPARKGEGEAVPSEIFAYVKEAFAPRSLPDLFPYDCSEYEAALVRYFAACDEKEYVQGGATTSASLGRYLALKEVFESGDFGHGMAVDPDALRSRAQKADVEEAGRLYFAGEISPTLLEDYFTCPYKSFAERALRLERREERAPFDPADAGTFIHTVLERAAKMFNTFADEAECAAYARECATALLEEPRFSSLADTKAGGYTARALVRDAGSVAVASFRQLAGSRFRVKATEAEIRIPALHLFGKADRVDNSEGSVRVIDYKTGGFDDSPTAYYTGQRLQLELYLLATAEDGMRPDGAFYFPAADDFTKEEDRAGKFRMKGFFCNDPEVVAGMDTSRESGKSEFFEGGERSQKGLPREEFEAFLRYSLLVSSQAEDEMRAGHVRPSPYEKACEYCKLKGMCAFAGSPRGEDAIRCAEIAAIVREKENK